ncbi:dipeptidase PepE [Paucihalobacter sp.]|uniref:dipeptidase PepE n=1 Tax=Paucihalobacter sp. TaxID=2850405 RepID=UPI002FE2C4BD
MNVILASTSTVYGSQPLTYLKTELLELYRNTNEVLFIPYARPGGISHEAYTKRMNDFFASIEKKLVGIHEFENPLEAIHNAKGIFTGGGNTFVLLHQLNKSGLLEALKNAIQQGTPYLGTSAGSNICGLTINNTNDMPIIYPSSFKSLGIVPFNINPHYIDPEANSTHMGETRATRILEFHVYNTPPVVGLREGSWLELSKNGCVLKGTPTARIFEQNKQPYELPSLSDLSFLK